MKTKITLVVAFLFCTLTMNAQNFLFDNLPDNDDITVVYVSKGMLSLIGDSIRNLKTENLSGKLDQLEMYTTKKSSLAKMMIKKTAALTKGKPYKTLAKVKNKDEEIILYTKTENEIVKELIIVMNETGECTIIRILGDFAAEDIDAIMDR